MKVTVLGVLAAVLCAGAEPYCGTWIQLSAKMEPPSRVTIEVVSSTLSLTSSGGTDHSVPMDAKDHSVAGKPYTLAWTMVDPLIWEEVRKTNGEVTMRSLRTLSSNRDEMTIDIESNGVRQENPAVYDRVPGTTRGKQPFAGVWEYNVKSLPQEGSELKVVCDGNTPVRYEVNGEAGPNASLKRIDDKSFESDVQPGNRNANEALDGFCRRRYSGVTV